MNKTFQYVGNFLVSGDSDKATVTQNVPPAIIAIFDKEMFVYKELMEQPNMFLRALKWIQDYQEHHE